LGYKETKLEETSWRRYDEKTRLYDLGWGKTLNHCPDKFRIILVEKEQEKLKMKKRKRFLHYTLSFQETGSKTSRRAEEK
jgi:hypothetical protein